MLLLEKIQPAGATQRRVRGEDRTVLHYSLGRGKQKVSIDGLGKVYSSEPPQGADDDGLLDNVERDQTIGSHLSTFLSVVLQDPSDYGKEENHDNNNNNNNLIHK